MKTQTSHEVILLIEQIEVIIAKAKENQRREPAMSDQMKFRLVFDTDKNAHVIDGTTGYQFSSYAECNGALITI